MRSFFTHLKCPRCGGEVKGFEYACPKCGSGLEAQYDLEAVKDRLNKASLGLRRVWSMWRYAELLPPKPENVVSLGEGFTPLIRSEGVGEVLGLRNLMLKLDFSNPTGSFKDRGASVMISMAKELGFKEAVLDSSGNAASSISAYSARLGIECFVFVPDYASEGKLLQSSAYGAKVFKIRGTRGDVYKAADYVRKRFGWYYCGFQANPFAIEGPKTIAFEILEQLDWAVPDWILFPVGTGSGILGIYKGLWEMRALGLIDRFPALACVQPEGCCPIASALKTGSEEIKPIDKPETIAEGLMIGAPLNGQRVMNAVRNTGGAGEIVSDAEIFRAGAELASFEGLFVEPSAAASLAGARKLVEGGAIDPDDTIVCVLTGSGLKTKTPYGDLSKIPTLSPIEGELEAAIKSIGLGRF
ncbi:MAG: threonine synthase [Candidatus Bathyarchaeia archaeon]